MEVQGVMLVTAGGQCHLGPLAELRAALQGLVAGLFPEEAPRLSVGPGLWPGMPVIF